MIKAIIYIGAFEPTSKPLLNNKALITTAVNPNNEDNEEIFSTLAQNPQTTAPISVGIGINTIKIPNPVATPFPPSSPKK